MTPCHAAALALVGWYLTRPPLPQRQLMPSTRTLRQLCGDERWVGASRPGRNARLTAPTHENDASPPTIRASRKNSDDRTAGGSFSSRDLRLGEHPSDPPHACVSLIPRQAAMANVKRLARKEKTAILVWLKIYLIRLLPFPAAESTAQRCKNAHLPYPR